MNFLNHLKLLVQILLILWVCFFIYRLIGFLSLFNKYDEFGISLIFLVILSLVFIRVSLILIFSIKNMEFSILHLIINSLFKAEYYVFCLLIWFFLGLMSLFIEPIWSIFTDVKQFEIVQTRYVGVAEINTGTDYDGFTYSNLSGKRLFLNSDVDSINAYVQWHSNFEEKYELHKYLFWQTAFLDGYKFSTLKNNSSQNSRSLAIINLLFYKLIEEVINSLRLTILFFVLPMIMYFKGLNLKELFLKLL
jgi:hypothetical protein